MGVTDVDRLVGFCLLFRRTLMDQIGLLDERFGIGCYEDDDFCRRALDAGYSNEAIEVRFEVPAAKKPEGTVIFKADPHDRDSVVLASLNREPVFTPPAQRGDNR